MKHQSPVAISMLKAKSADNTNLCEELLVLIVNNIEEQRDVEIEYFDKDEPDN